MSEETRFYIRPASWPEEADALKAVRTRVFVQEQQVPQELEWDDSDPVCCHFLAEDRFEIPIAAARLTPGGQIGRMAVLPPWRRKGVGSSLLEEILRYMKRMDYPPPFLNAQSRVITFYRRHGFVPLGDEFEEAGILHQRMELSPHD